MGGPAVTARKNDPLALLDEYYQALIVDVVREACQLTSELHDRTGPLLETLVEMRQPNLVNGTLHAKIAEGLIRGGGTLPRPDQHHDIELRGLPIDIKTTSGLTISTNSVYQRSAADHGRWVLAINFRRRRAPDQRILVTPWMIRFGYVAPTDYEPAPAGRQMAKMSRAAAARMHTLWLADMADWPPDLVPGLGKETLRQLNYPQTIDEARAEATGRDDRHTLTLIGRADHGAMLGRMGASMPIAIGSARKRLLTANMAGVERITGATDVAGDGGVAADHVRSQGRTNGQPTAARLVRGEVAVIMSGHDGRPEERIVEMVWLPAEGRFRSRQAIFAARLIDAEDGRVYQRALRLAPLDVRQPERGPMLPGYLWLEEISQKHRRKLPVIPQPIPEVNRSRPYVLFGWANCARVTAASRHNEQDLTDADLTAIVDGSQG